MIPTERLREIAESRRISPSWVEVEAMAADLLAARETIERLTKERDAEAREAAGYQKIAKEAADAEKPGLLVLLVNQDGSEVRIFGPDRDAEERFGETVARWWKLLHVTSECLEHEDRIKAVEAERDAVTRHRDDLLAICRRDSESAYEAVLSGRKRKMRLGAMLVRDAVAELVEQRDAARAEAKKYHDALVARHGGEPVALLSELDAARADAKQARRDGQEIASGLHEKLAEVRAECARVAKQRDELVGLAMNLLEPIETMRPDALCRLIGFAKSLVDAIAAEQPKPQGEGGAP